MEYDTIRLHEQDDIARITMARGEVMNALNAQMRAELTHAIKASSKRNRVLVLTGQGRAFCSGQDLGDKSNIANLDLERTLRDEYLPLLRAIVDSPVPTIAAVNGAAAGAGANLALACDVAIATESAVFLQAFTRIGLIPDAGGSYFLPRQIGLARAMGAALFAEKISAQQAQDWGMIWEMVPDADFDAHWQRRAATLAQGPSIAYANVKRALRESLDNSLEAQLSLEGQLQGQCGHTRDFREGVLAFAEKRAPNYEGR